MTAKALVNKYTLTVDNFDFFQIKWLPHLLQQSGWSDMM